MNKTKSFKITSGKLLITDPCYASDDFKLNGKVKAKNGRWKASVEFEEVGEIWGTRVATLSVRHADLKLDKSVKFTKLRKGFCVDSGQCGFFDYESYRSQDQFFYEDICEETLSDDGFGVVKFGAASSSGFGDGVYDCYVYRQGGEVVAATLVYM